MKSFVICHSRINRFELKLTTIVIFKNCIILQSFNESFIYIKSFWISWTWPTNEFFKSSWNSPTKNFPHEKWIVIQLIGNVSNTAICWRATIYVSSSLSLPTFITFFEVKVLSGEDKLFFCSFVIQMKFNHMFSILKFIDFHTSNSFLIKVTTR